MGRVHKAACIAAGFSMMLLIFDSAEAINAASEGIELCIRTAIPSLFPFFVLSVTLVPGISGFRIPVLGRIMKLPDGMEAIFLLGSIGGYPVGAQCIAQCYRSGQLSKLQAERMLGLCNNCGPAFLFGVVAPLFPHFGYGVVIMILGILSAGLVGAIWPAAEQGEHTMISLSPVTLPKAVRQAIQSMASVCAWIILGKIVLHYMELCILGHLPFGLQILFSGFLEMTNGCIALQHISDLSSRFLVACMIVPFGGLCVAMQVSSICADAGLSCRTYLIQKTMQSTISAVLAWLLWKKSIPLAAIVCAGFWILLKTAVAFRKNMMYNGSGKGGFHHAVPKEN